MAGRLDDEEKRRRAEEKARKRREREAAREARRRAKAEEKARRAREREERKRQKEIERGRRMKRRPVWLYWLVREQAAKRREHEQYMDAGRIALALGRAIRKIQKKIMAFIGPLINHVATLKTPEARLLWSREPWTPQERSRYNWGKKQELRELWRQFPDGIAQQDIAKAARDAKRKTRARKIDHAKAIDLVLDQLTRELAEDTHSAVTSSLERSYRRVYEDIYKELQDRRSAIDADKAAESRMADASDYADRRRMPPETRIPQNMPRFGSYGESVVFGAPSPDQIKAVLNAEFEGKDYSERIWKDRDRLARELKEMLQAAIINGENSRIVAQKLAQRMGVHFSHAQRLVRTEMNRILNQSIMDSAKASGADEYQFVAIEDSRTCSRCLKKNRKVYRMSEKRVGLNCPPLHPHCRCTIIARFAWEKDEDTPDRAMTTDKPTEDRGTQKTIEGWLKEMDAIDKAKADTLRISETKADAQAAVNAQDAGMKAAEQRQKTAIGRQMKAIQRGKPVANMTVKLQGKEEEKQTKQAEKKRPEGIPTEANFENSKRFGKKVGQHMKELGFNPARLEERQKYKDLVNATIQNANRIKRGIYTKQEPDALCYEKDDIIVLTRQNGEIITAYTQATSRKEHIPIEERRWYQEMKTIFDEEK